MIFAAVVFTAPGLFRIEQEVLVADAPAAAFDAFTGDVGGWWDH